MDMDSKLPLVCICIPAYNAEKTIERTLESLVKQTYKNIIIKIVNNNSSDRTLEIAEKYAKQYANITTYNFDITVPGEENFDRCLQLSEGDYTCLFHSDDVYDSHIIEREVSALQENDSLGAIFTCANIINENDVIVDQLVPREEFFENKIHTFDELFPLLLKYGSCFVTPSAMVKTNIYKNAIVAHKRKKEFSGACDVDTWIRILRKTNVVILKEKLINYRMSVCSYSFRHVSDYKNTLADRMVAVFRYNIDNECSSKMRAKYNILLQRIELKVLLNNARYAILNNDYCYARSLLNKCKDSKKYWRYTLKKYLYILYVGFCLLVFGNRKLKHKMDNKDTEF